jgi:hypothetical protein
VDRHDHRGVGLESQVAVGRANPFREDTKVVACPCLGDVVHRLLRLGLSQSPLPHRIGELGEDRIDVDVVVPDLEGRHLRSAAHGLSVGPDRSRDDVAPVRGAEAQIAPADLEARGQALHIPFPRPWKRLVEVVDVEHQLPLGRRKDAEVRQVGVPAQLDGDACPGGRCQIGGHDQCRAAEERER